MVIGGGGENMWISYAVIMCRGLKVCAKANVAVLVDVKGVTVTLQSLVEAEKFYIHHYPPPHMIASLLTNIPSWLLISKR